MYVDVSTYHYVQVYVWTSLVCVPMFEAHTTQLYISVCSVHMMETLVNMCITTSRATTLSVHTCTLSVRDLQEVSVH